MALSVDARHAYALVTEVDLDIVDLRDPAEWSAGHIPGARNVPFDQLLADVPRHIPRNGVLFVSSRGERSLHAATSAEAHGRTEVYSLDCGTQGWAAQGFNLESVVPRPSDPLLKSSRIPAASCASPAAYPDLHLGGQSYLHVLRKSDKPAPPAVRAKLSSRALFTPTDIRHVAFYELQLPAHVREHVPSQVPWTRHNLAVAAGRLDFVIHGSTHSLVPGDAVVFAADVPHTYINPGDTPCTMYLVVTHARPRGYTPVP